MKLFQFLATWLFPGAVVYAAADQVAVASAAVSFEHARTSSSSPTTSSVKAAESGSSPSSSSDDRPRFSPSRKQSPSLCFGAGGAGRLLWGGARARAPAKQEDEDGAAAASTAPKGDAVGRYLRRISRRLRKARSAGKGSPSASASPRGVDDDTARERAESVARAIAYCKDTIRRGAAAPTPPSPSLDDWLHLHDRQEDEIIASPEAHGKERRDSPQHPRRESRPATSPSRDDGSLTSAADTARDWAESVARAIAYCKDTLWRGVAAPTPPSPSLDDWLHLHDRQEDEIIASPEAHGKERWDSPQHPRRESRPATSPSRDDGSLTSAADTARDWAESVARAIAYCKDMLWRGAAAPTPPSPSLDDWLHLHDRQEDEIIASPEAHGKERRDSPQHPRRESRPATSPSRDDGSLTSAAAAMLVHGKESSPHHHDHGAGDECRVESVKASETAKSSSPSDLAAGGNPEMLGSLDEMEFLKIFDGDEEMIDHHFITIQI